LKRFFSLENEVELEVEVHDGGGVDIRRARRNLVEVKFNCLQCPNSLHTWFTPQILQWTENLGRIVSTVEAEKSV